MRCPILPGFGHMALSDLEDMTRAEPEPAGVFRTWCEPSSPQELPVEVLDDSPFVLFGVGG